MNARGKFRYTLLLAGSLCAAVPCFAAETTETVDARITRLEQELAELKALVKNRPAVTVSSRDSSTHCTCKKSGTPDSTSGINRFGCQNTALRFCPL